MIIARPDGVNINYIIVGNQHYHPNTAIIYAQAHVREEDPWTIEFEKET